MSMDPAYVSALAALAGSAVGGLTSLATTWLTQHSQYRTQQHERDLARREELYRDFIQEASKLYADACEHDQVEISKLVAIMALINRMRVLSSPEIVEKADDVMRLIIETYLAPIKAFGDVLELVHSKELNPLREFSIACREELQSRRSS